MYFNLQTHFFHQLYYRICKLYYEGEKMITDIGSIKDSDSRVLLKMWKATVPPGERPLFRHSHIMFEITYVVSGDGIYTVGKTTDVRSNPMQRNKNNIFPSFILLSYLLSIIFRIALSVSRIPSFARRETLSMVFSTPFFTIPSPPKN